MKLGQEKRLLDHFPQCDFSFLDMNLDVNRSPLLILFLRKILWGFPTPPLPDKIMPTIFTAAERITLFYSFIENIFPSSMDQYHIRNQIFSAQYLYSSRRNIW